MNLEPVELNKYILYSIENYKENITNTSQEIATKFVDVMIHFINIMVDKLLSKKQTHYKFILERGIDTLSHVFQMTYCITKNLEVAYHCCQKAFCFYTEFIEQMSDDNVSFLKLTSRDATLFVYKKTIYDINNECRKNMKPLSQQEQQILEDANNIIHFNKIICMFVINNSDMSIAENRRPCITQCINIIQTIDKMMTMKREKEFYKSKNIENIFLLVCLLSKKDISVNRFFECIKKYISDYQHLPTSRMQMTELIEHIENEPI
jgi:hypothetical protein